MNKLSRLVLLSLFCLSCHPRVTIIPDSREIVSIPEKPGYYIISAGHLKLLFDQQRILAEELEKCRFNTIPAVK